jgi:ATP-binding cassette subfamily F protein 3
MDLRLTVKTQPGRTILELHDVKKSFGDKQVLKGCDALMERGDKIALIGANGMGKSTLLRIMAGLTEHTGTLKLGHNVKPAYFAQHQAEALDPNRTMLDELAYHAGGMIERELRTILGAFLFTGEDVLKKTGVLSGGEKARVALAKLITSDANFLLLDEPTNHLDMLSVEVLMEALERYEGTYIVVSHDRYFLSEIANKIWYIEEGFLKEYPGTYEEFEEWKAERDAKKPKQNSSSAIAKSEKAPESSSTKQSAAKPASNQLAKLQKELAELELKQNAKRAEISMLEAEAIMPDVYTNKSKMATVVDKLHACRVELQKLDEHWEAMFAKMIEEES